MISVVIPVVNQASDLEQTLRGLVAEKQAHDIEVLVVDGGSRDESLKGCRTVRLGTGDRCWQGVHKSFARQRSDGVLGRNDSVSGAGSCA